MGRRRSFGVGRQIINPVSSLMILSTNHSLWQMNEMPGPVFGAGTVVMFGDWCVVQAQRPPSLTSPMEETGGGALGLD